MSIQHRIIRSDDYSPLDKHWRMKAFTQVLRTYCEQLKARASQSTDTKNKEEQI